MLAPGANTAGRASSMTAKHGKVGCQYGEAPLEPGPRFSELADSRRPRTYLGALASDLPAWP